MYPTIYKTLRLLWPGGFEIRQLLQELERTQWLPPEELQAMQFAKIKEIVKHAFQHVPYYRQLYQSLDIHPEDIKDLKDFQSLPFLTKEDIKKHLDTLVWPDLRHKAYLSATGGTTGQPMQFYVDRSFWRVTQALSIRGGGWYGVREGDKVAWVWGAQRDLSLAKWKARLRRYRYLDAFSMTRTRMQEFAEMLVLWKPVVIRAYASALSLFAEYLQEQGITEIRPRLIEARSERLAPHQRALLEEVFQCTVADVYGSRELGVIAYQCPEGGRHVGELRYVEIVEGDQVAPAGQMGEIVVTSLSHFAMPLIRYRTGDMACLEESPCSCGRGLPVLCEIMGREHDFLTAPSGELVHPEWVDHFFSSKQGIIRYQVYQPERDQLEVRLVCKNGIDPGLSSAILKGLQAWFGTSMRISIQVVDQIELTSAGKHRSVMSDVGPVVW